jgi:bifunctional oligoribonuclease and PAP phosphatase NrnA
MAATDPEIEQIAAALRTRQRFVISSHSRPDGDSIGSQLAMAFGLRALGKSVTVVNLDPAAQQFMVFPGVRDIKIAPSVEGDFDAAIIMECSDYARTGVSGLDRFFTINIDHHPGNSRYGQINWFDPSAAACAEMVFDVVQALRVPLSIEIATHVYVAILTDTGSFHFSNLSPRTFDICKQLLEAGLDPVRIARQVYDSSSLGRLKLYGAIMTGMQVDDDGRIAVLYVDHAMAKTAGATYDDTEGVINQPLTVKELQAVVFFKQSDGNEYRVSMRSKGEVDVGVVAKEFGGGGHKNAAGCTVRGNIDELRATFVARVTRAINGRTDRH